MVNPNYRERKRGWFDGLETRRGSGGGGRPCKGAAGKGSNRKWKGPMDRVLEGANGGEVQGANGGEVALANKGIERRFR